MQCLRLARRYCMMERVLKNYHFHDDYDYELKMRFVNNFFFFPEFISEREEHSLHREISPKLRRMRYEYDHWDNAIHGFREYESKEWSKQNLEIFKRLQSWAFLEENNFIGSIHVLDLSENGFIKPHVDSSRYCGRTIASLSLFSDSIMRLKSEGHNMVVDILLSRRSLYVMRDFVRYYFTHEILPNDQSVFIDQKIIKKRRVSIVCRSEAKSKPEDF